VDVGDDPRTPRPIDEGEPLTTSALFDCYDAFILDMDGTLTRGATLLPGAAAFLRDAAEAHKRLVVLTDNSTRSRDEIAALLSRSGIRFPSDRVVTSARAAAVELHRRLGPCRVRMVGEPALADDLRAMGHDVVSGAPADAVVVGFTDRFGYATLAETLPILVSGAPLIATDEAPVYAAPQGTMPGAGSLVGAFRGMGYAPMCVAGKPRGAAVDLSLELVGAPRGRVALIGDSLSNDGGAARHLGVDFILVLTGVSSSQEARNAVPHPARVYRTLADAARDVVR